MPTRFNGPILTSVKYQKGSLENSPIKFALGGEFTELFYDFIIPIEVALTSADGPWADSSDVGVPAGATFTQTANPATGGLAGILRVDAGTSANTGNTWVHAGAGIGIPLTSGTSRLNFVYTARLAKNGNADTFGACGLMAAVAAPLTTAGAFNSGAVGMLFRIDGTGTIHSTLSNAAALSGGSDTVTHGLDVYDTVSIVGKNLSQVGSLIGAGVGTGSLDFYVGPRRIQSWRANDSTSLQFSTSLIFSPMVCAVNGTSTVGHTQFDYIGLSVNRF